MYLFVLYLFIHLSIFIPLFLSDVSMYALHDVNDTLQRHPPRDLSPHNAPKWWNFFLVASIQIYTQILVNHFQHNNWQRSRIRTKTKKRKP